MYTVKQAAKILGVSRATVGRWVTRKWQGRCIPIVDSETFKVMMWTIPDSLVNQEMKERAEKGE